MLVFATHNNGGYSDEQDIRSAAEGGVRGRGPDVPLHRLGARLHRFNRLNPNFSRFASQTSRVPRSACRSSMIPLTIKPMNDSKDEITPAKAVSITPRSNATSADIRNSAT